MVYVSVFEVVFREDLLALVVIYDVDLVPHDQSLVLVPFSCEVGLRLEMAFMVL